MSKRSVDDSKMRFLALSNHKHYGVDIFLSCLNCIECKQMELN